MTMRLSIRSLAGTARTLVAVGTARLASMLVTVRAATPRRRTSSAPLGTWGAGAAFFSGFSGFSGLPGFSGAFCAGLASALPSVVAAAGLAPSPFVASVAFCWGAVAVEAACFGAGVGGDAAALSAPLPGRSGW